MLQPFLCFLVLLGAGPAAAIDPNAGTGGATFLKLGAGSPRALALGRAYVALAEGPDAAVWNPAGVGVSRQRELSFSYMDWVQGYSGNTLGYVHPLGRTVWGAHLGYFTAGDFEVRDSNGIPLQGDTVKVRDGFGIVTVARSFFLERLFVGASLKGILEDNNGTRHQNLVEDGGILFKPSRRLSLGLAYQNLGADSASVARISRWGAAYQFNPFFTASLEISKESDNSARPGIGLEFTLPEDLLEVGRLDFRAGYYGSDNYGQSLSGFLQKLKLDKASGVSLGLGLETSGFLGYGMGLDYALVPLGALGTAHHIGIRIQF